MIQMRLERKWKRSLCWSMFHLPSVSSCWTSEIG